MAFPANDLRAARGAQAVGVRLLCLELSQALLHAPGGDGMGIATVASGTLRPSLAWSAGVRLPRTLYVPHTNVVRCRRRGVAGMKQRWIAAVLLLALAFQGPIFAYSPVLVPCSSMPGRARCDSCCSHGQCAALCTHPSIAAVPAPAGARIALLRATALPDPRVVSVIGAAPAQPFRPPIA